MLSQLRDKSRFSTIICSLSIHLLCGTRSPVWCLKPSRVVKTIFPVCRPSAGRDSNGTNLGKPREEAGSNKFVIIGTRPVK